MSIKSQCLRNIRGVLDQVSGAERREMYTTKTRNDFSCIPFSSYFKELHRIR